MRSSTKGILTIVIGIFIASCAQMKVPTGGPTDTTPPEILGAYPPNQSINFQEKQVQLLFDEYVDLTDPNTNVVISPPMDEMPTFTLRGKKLFIKFNEELKANTTYNIYLGAAIKDITEGNTIQNYQYVFSTGAYIDSLKTTGVVVSANDNTAQKDVLVMLYKELSDSVVSNQKPYYFARTDESGKFTIKHVGAGTYKLFALQDQNNNLLYDLNGEAIAFWPEPIVITGDSSAPRLDKFQLQLFTTTDPETKLIWSSTKNPGSIQLAYNKPIDKVKLQVLDTTALSTHFQEVINPTKDTITYWYTNLYKENPEIVITVNDTLNDTLAIRSEPIEKDKTPFEYLRCEEQDSRKTKDLKAATNTIDIGSNIELHWPRPIVNLNSAAVFLVKDSTDTLTVDLAIIENTAQRFTKVIANYQPGALYDLYIADSAFTDAYGISNKAFELSYKVRKPEDYGNIELQLDSLESDKQYILSIIKGEVTIEKSVITGIEGSKNFTLKNYLPGKYSITITYDTNKNGKWDSGDFYKGLQPERTYQYPDGVDLKANWDVEVVIAVTR